MDSLFLNFILIRFNVITSIFIWKIFISQNLHNLIMFMDFQISNFEMFNKLICLIKELQLFTNKPRK